MDTGRLALLRDTYYAEAAGQVLVLTHRGRVVLNGPSVHLWLDRLAPLLNAERTLPELTEGLPPDRRHMVEKIVSVLLERGVVRAVHHDEPHRLSSQETATHRAELDFIACFRDSAGSAFERYRNATALVFGAGPLVPAVARAAGRSGVQNVRVVTTTECPTDAELAALLRGVDLVVHVCDRDMLSRARLLDRLCAQHDIPLVQAMSEAGQVWMGPVGRVDADRPGASDGWQRLVALAGDGARDPGTTIPARAAAAAPTVVAGQIVQELFRHATGAHPPAPSTPPRRGRMTRILADTLRRESHNFLAHPFSLPAAATGLAELVDRVGALDNGPTLDAEEFSRRAAACSDARLGVFGAITEEDFAQLPLHVTQTTVSDPVGLLGPAAPLPVVTGASRDFAAARYQAALRALAGYASLMVDPRRLLTEDGLRRAVDGDDPRTALDALRGGESYGWVGGLDLADHRPRLLAASTVFPALCHPATPYRPPRGVAAAYDWASALRAGLVQHCRHLAVVAAIQEATPFPLTDLDGTGADEATRWYLDMVRALGEPLAVYEITAPFGVPTFACLLSGRTVSYGCGVSAEEALRDGLHRLLLSYQARADGTPAYAPAPVPGFTTHLRGTSRRPMTSRPPLDVADLVAALARSGRRAVAVPLDHDPEMSSIMPYIAHVVLDR